MSAQTVLPVDRGSVADLSKRNQEPEWMAELRLKGLELAESLELPALEKTKLDRWNLSHYGSYHKSAAIAAVTDLPEEAKGLFGENFSNSLLIQRNSGAIYSSLSEAASAQGVIFMELERAVREHADLVKPYFMKAVEQGENRLTALHSAVWNGGVFLYVPKNVQVELPVQALFLTEGADASCAPHVLIVAEANSSVTYVENVLSLGETGERVVSGVVEVFAKQGSKVQIASVHNLNTQMTDIAYRRAIIENDARVEWTVGEMNYGNAVSDTTSLLKGNGSSSDSKVICVGTGEQKLNLTTRAVHFGKMSSSDMITRAVMRDGSTAIINGITKIEKGATGANGQQTEKVLMLSPKSRGDANPILLIDEDDVKAGHAASVGQVNPEQVYYLMSRGISKEIAQRLIIYGFLAPVVSEIPIAKIEDQLQALVERKLEQ
ncbi:Fe-S cluster assembly protein SufD [Gorillibacterium sp. sgz5001074]|uniref:Fe-S cluster assembly protein SufD n=1 Tax=Gorillibacterium sp. sgz5001074 TaxID=3446695 RepID=UPI003F66AAAB